MRGSSGTTRQSPSPDHVRRILLGKMGSMIRLAARARGPPKPGVAANGASTARVDQASTSSASTRPMNSVPTRCANHRLRRPKAQGRTRVEHGSRSRKPPRRCLRRNRKASGGAGKDRCDWGQSSRMPLLRPGLLPPMPFGSKATVRTKLPPTRLADHIRSGPGGRKEGDEDEKTEEQYLADGWTRSGCDHEENRHPRTTCSKIRSPAA